MTRARSRWRQRLGRAAAARALLAWFLTPLALGGCGGGDCESDSVVSLVLARRDVGCPSAKAANAFVAANETVNSLVSATPLVPNRTICWYRRIAQDWMGECFGAPHDGGVLGFDSRDRYLEIALGTAPRPLAGPSDYHEPTASLFIASCDADGLLYGGLLTDPSGDILATDTAADCPPELANPPPSSPAFPLETGELVGNDLYPALVTCRYELTTVRSCGGVGAPPGPVL